MGAKVEVGYGHTTHCFLSQCNFCGKPYDPRESWRTAHSFSEKTNSVMWLLFCEECWEEMEKHDKEVEE